jgi:hypothetical protein
MILVGFGANLRAQGFSDLYRAVSRASQNIIGQNGERNGFA